jgi:hypothetical protein
MMKLLVEIKNDHVGIGEKDVCDVLTDSFRDSTDATFTVRELSELPVQSKNNLIIDMWKLLQTELSTRKYDEFEVRIKKEGIEI